MTSLTDRATANDVAELHVRADELRPRASWAVVADDLGGMPYVVDRETHVVYVYGGLDLQRYYEAVRDGLDELVYGVAAVHSADVTVLRPRVSL